MGAVCAGVLRQQQVIAAGSQLCGRRRVNGLQLLQLVVDGLELPAPVGAIQEGPVVEPIIVGAVALGVHRRRQHGHLVSIDGIAAKEVLHLVGHLLGREVTLPGGHQLAEHAVRAAEGLLAQSSILAQLSIGHAHVLLVRLQQLAVLLQRLQFSRGRCLDDLPQHGQIVSVRGAREQWISWTDFQRMHARFTSPWRRPENDADLSSICPQWD